MQLRISHFKEATWIALLWRTGKGLSDFLLAHNVYKEIHIKWKIFLFIHVHADHTGPVAPGSFMNLAGFDFIDIFFPFTFNSHFMLYLQGKEKRQHMKIASCAED